MAQGEQRALVQYRITPSREAVPQVGNVLHACGLTNWHVVVLRIVETLPQNEDGTLDVRMSVRRTEIGKEYRPCPVCGATWMANAGAEQ